MSNLWYILNKSELSQQQLQEQLQHQLRQQLEVPPSMMNSERFSGFTSSPTTTAAASSPSPLSPGNTNAATPRAGDVVPYSQSYSEMFDPANAPPGLTSGGAQVTVVTGQTTAVAAPGGEGGPPGPHSIEWKYHSHRPEQEGDTAGRKAGKRKLLIPRDLLKMKQMHAAMKVGIPPSTFSKRWRESLPERTWPYRNHRRIEKNIKMLKTMQQKGHDVTEELNRMVQQQEENVSPAVIDVYEDVNEEYLLKPDDKKWAGRQLPPAPQSPQQLLTPALPSSSQSAYPYSSSSTSQTSQPQLVPQPADTADNQDNISSHLPPSQPQPSLGDEQSTAHAELHQVPQPEIQPVIEK